MGAAKAAEPIDRDAVWWSTHVTRVLDGDQAPPGNYEGSIRAVAMRPVAAVTVATIVQYRTKLAAVNMSPVGARTTISYQHQRDAVSCGPQALGSH